MFAFSTAVQSLHLNYSTIDIENIFKLNNYSPNAIVNVRSDYTFDFRALIYFYF